MVSMVKAGTRDFEWDSYRPVPSVIPANSFKALKTEYDLLFLGKNYH